MQLMDSSAEAKPKSRESKPKGMVTPHQPTKLQRFAAFVIWLLVRAVTLTLRLRYEDPHGLYAGKHQGPAIYCVWHNRLALCLKGYFSFAKKRTGTPGMAAMASASRDGAFLAAIIERFGVKPVRGSSSRRGGQALLELTTWADKGWDLAITPDGPRGPRYVVQSGALSLAQLTGLPIIPAGYNLQWKLQLKTWDKFQVPLPFSKCQIIVGQPMFVPRDSTDEMREALRVELEQQLRKLNHD